MTDVFAVRLAAALERHTQGDSAAAADIYRSILAERPGHPDALHLLGVIAQQRGNPELALKLIEAALAHQADYAAAWSNRALVLHTLGRSLEALQSIRMATDMDATMATAWDFTATLLRHLKQYDAALQSHRRALALEPDNKTFKANYAASLLTTGAIRAAYAAIGAGREPDESHSLKSDVPAVLGNILQAAGYPDRAMRCFHAAALASPQAPGIFVNEGLARLKLGDYVEGFRLWQTRADGKEAFFAAVPRWQGPYGDKARHLLLYEDQGMGDAIQCLRYLPLLAAYAAKRTVQIAEPLRRLIADRFPDVEARSLDQPVPEADARVSLMSLPFYFGTSLETIPATIPYLQASKDLIAVWQDRLATRTRPRIGLVWGGNPGYPNDKNRSVPFAQLQPLIESAGSHLLSLQIGRPDDDARRVESGIADLAPLLGDFADTAAALTAIDLLITVDTAIAHLAGALGRPVWLMLPFDPDWRWMLEREDSPWYPTIKLFRQTKPGDWGGVIQELAVNAQKYLQGDQAILHPARWQGPPAQRNSHALDLSFPGAS